MKVSRYAQRIHADLSRRDMGMTETDIERIYGKPPAGNTAAVLLAGPFRSIDGLIRAVEVTKPDRVSEDGPEVSTRALRASSVWSLAA